MIQFMKKLLGTVLAISIGVQAFCGLSVQAEEQDSDARSELEAILQDDSILLQADPNAVCEFYFKLATITLSFYAETCVGSDLQATDLWMQTMDADQDGIISLSDATVFLTIYAEIAVGNITGTLPIVTTTVADTTTVAVTETTVSDSMTEITTTKTELITETKTSIGSTVTESTSLPTGTSVTNTTNAAITTTVNTTYAVTTTAPVITSVSTATTVKLPENVLAHGIDVSKYQGYVDWETVKSSGDADFAIIRAGYGKYVSQEDPYFDVNMHNAKAAGVNCGAYWFSYALTPEDAVLEAEAFLKVIDGYQFEYPVVFDMESTAQQSLTQAQASAIADAFCSTLEDAGYYVSVYSFVSFLNTKFSDEIYKKYDVWAAHFNVSKPNFTRAFYGMWQYTSTSHVSGIDGNVDADYAYRDFPVLMRQFSLNGY